MDGLTTKFGPSVSLTDDKTDDKLLTFTSNITD